MEIKPSKTIRVNGIVSVEQFIQAAVKGMQEEAQIQDNLKQALDVLSKEIIGNQLQLFVTVKGELEYSTNYMAIGVSGLDLCQTFQGLMPEFVEKTMDELEKQEDKIKFQKIEQNLYTMLGSLRNVFFTVGTTFDIPVTADSSPQPDLDFGGNDGS